MQFGSIFFFFLLPSPSPLIHLLPSRSLKSVGTEYIIQEHELSRFPNPSLVIFLSQILYFLCWVYSLCLWQISFYWEHIPWGFLPHTRAVNDYAKSLLPAIPFGILEYTIMKPDYLWSAVIRHLMGKDCAELSYPEQHICWHGSFQLTLQWAPPASYSFLLNYAGWFN